MAPEDNPFSYMTEEEIKSILGTRIYSEEEIPTQIKYNADDLPVSYDAKAEGDCFQEVRDQASCGACWAFGATSALSQRFCKQYGINVLLSNEDMVECDTRFNRDCEGGILTLAWNYIAKKGVVTENCYPYTSGQGVVGTCKDTCANGANFADDKFTIKEGTKVHPKSIIDIKAEIFRIEF